MVPARLLQGPELPSVRTLPVPGSTNWQPYSKALAVDHSIPGAGAFGIKTSEGWIIYTGDLRLHGGRAADTRAFMEEAARLEPLALICEGTHPDTETPVGEEEVYAYAAEAVRKALGLVVADFGPRNIAGPSRQHCFW